MVLGDFRKVRLQSAKASFRYLPIDLHQIRRSNHIDKEIAVLVLRSSGD